MNFRDVYKTVISSRDHVLGFGKHKGRSVAFLMDAEPEYLQWCIDNEVLSLSPSLQDEFEQMNPWMQTHEQQWRDKRIEDYYK